MTSDSSSAPTSRTVTIFNALMIVLLLVLGYKEYVDQKSLLVLTGRDLGVSTFIFSNVSRVALRCAIVAMLLLGLVLELRRSRVAWIANIGVPLMALAVLVIQMAAHWKPETAGETGQLLFLVATPLLCIVLLYTAIYYRRHSHYSDRD